MGRMTRTQITLEPDEHLFLKTRAAEEGTSLSAIIRTLVREKMEQIQSERPSVRDLAGLITGSDFSGKDHDRILYGEPAPEPTGKSVTTPPRRTKPRRGGHGTASRR